MTKKHTDPIPFFDARYLEDYTRVIHDVERTRRETDVIERVLDCGKDAAVLDLACGVGRHAVELASRGYADVTGIDAVPKFLSLAKKAARRRGVKVAFLRGDMRRLGARARYDRVYNWFTAWGYYDHETNVKSLRSIASALRPHGRFALEMISRDHVVRFWSLRDWERKDDGTLVLFDRRFDLSTGLACMTVERVKGNKRSARKIEHYIYSPSELRRMMLAAGFKRVDVFAGDGESPLRPGGSNNRMILVGRV